MVVVGWVVAHVIIVSPPVPIGLGFGFWTALGLGLRGLDLGLGLDNCKKDNKERQGKGHMRLALFGAMLVVIA